MAQISGVGTSANLPNYAGLLATADRTNTPIFTRITAIHGLMETGNFEFPTSSEYDFPDSEQPEITETESLTAPTATEAVRGQVNNTTQMFHQTVYLSYKKMANRLRLAGLNTQGAVNNVQSELDFQIEYNLKIIARNIEYTIINGTYQEASDAGTAGKTRGLLATCALTGGNAVDAGSTNLTLAILNSFFKEIYDNGGNFVTPVLWMDSTLRPWIDAVYGFAPTSREKGGTNITTIVTTYGDIEIAMPHRDMPSGTILYTDLSAIKPVVQEVPERGNFFYEPLAKTGAGESGQLFGFFGLDHGASFASCGKLTNLTTV